VLDRHGRKGVESGRLDARARCAPFSLPAKIVNLNARKRKKQEDHREGMRGNEYKVTFCGHFGCMCLGLDRRRAFLASCEDSHLICRGAEKRKGQFLSSALRFCACMLVSPVYYKPSVSCML